MHHLDRRAMAATDLGRQFLTEHSELVSIWSPDVRGQVSIDGRSPSPRSKENQLRELGGGQPREPAAIVSPTESQAPVAIKAVPAEIGDLQRFAAHGLYGVPEERLNFTDLGSHLECSTSSAQGARFGRGAS
ncbi:MAG TPA: hypothetical protein VMS40_13200 [Vicinamibacterales bacterium]|nr:hypothetical protein [Vicinamibacterales bacterium]